MPGLLIRPIEILNKELRDLFGIDTVTGDPIWRVVWSEDQYEKRLVKFSDGGIEYIHPVIEKRKKYTYIKDRFILEQLVLVPELQQAELAGKKISYECLWTFEDNKGNPLPPKLEACQLIINTVNAVKGKSSLAKYVDNSEEPDVKKARLKKIHEELFGNETNVGDALAYKTGVVNPYQKES